MGHIRVLPIAAAAALLQLLLIGGCNHTCDVADESARVFSVRYVSAISTSDANWFVELIHPSCRSYYEQNVPGFLESWFASMQRDYAAVLKGVPRGRMKSDILAICSSDDSAVGRMTDVYGVSGIRKLRISCDISAHQSISFTHYVAKDSSRKMWLILFPVRTLRELMGSDVRERANANGGISTETGAVEGILNTAKQMSKQGYTHESSNLIRRAQVIQEGAD